MEQLKRAISIKINNKTHKIIMTSLRIILFNKLLKDRTHHFDIILVHISQIIIQLSTSNKTTDIIMTNISIIRLLLRLINLIIIKLYIMSQITYRILIKSI